ncbi:MAG TPA: hypothetical protein VIG99_02190 [Myxococcaceae bacterium]|jgi:hypothetical protein
MTRARSWLLAAAAVCLVSGGCVCLDLTQPRRYRCADDTQCAAGWRCGTDHFCVDPSGDALQPNAAAPQVTVAQFTPADSPSLPDLLASTRERAEFPSSCADAGHGSKWSAEPIVAQVRGDTVSVTAVFRSGRESLPDGGLPTGPDCASFTGAPPVYQERWEGSLGGRRALDVAQIAGATYVLTESGGLCTFSFAPGTPGLTGSCKNGVFSFSPTRLRTSPNDDAYMLAHSSSTYALYSLGDGGVGQASQVAIFGGRPMSFTEMTIQDVGGRDYELLTAVNDAGLFVTSLARHRFEPDGGGTPAIGFWEPVQTNEVACQRDPASSEYGAPLGIRYVDDYSNLTANPVMGLHVTQRSGFGGGGLAEDHVLVYRATNDAGFPYYGSCVPLPAPSSNPPGFPFFYWQSLADCAPCEADHHMRDWRLAWQFPGPTLVIEARCLPNDGGTVETVNAVQDAINECRSEPLTLPDIARFTRPSRWDRADGYANAYANDLGHLFGSAFTEGLTLPALTLDRPPDVLVQTASGLLGATAEELIGDPFGSQQAVLIPREVFRQSRHGFGGSGNDQLNFLSGVAGQPTWGLVGDPDPDEELFIVVENTTRPLTGEFIPLRILAHFNAAVSVQPPFLGAATRSALGREVLMFASNDVLTAVDVTALADDPNAGGFDEAAYFASPELEVRAVPLPRTPITSLVPIPPDPAAAPPLFAEAFLVQGGRVFQVTAFNHTYWKAEELDLGGAEVIAVVADGRRGRAGTKEGRVYALPSRVPVSEALPGSGTPVLGYAQAGATTFAVASGGVFRLRTDGSSPLGTWEAVAVTPMPPDGRGYQSARLFSIADELLLFLHAGWGYRISGGR